MAGTRIGGTTRSSDAASTRHPSTTSTSMIPAITTYGETSSPTTNSDTVAGTSASTSICVNTNAAPTIARIVADTWTVEMRIRRQDDHVRLRQNTPTMTNDSSAPTAAASVGVARPV